MRRRMRFMRNVKTLKRQNSIDAYPLYVSF